MQENEHALDIIFRMMSAFTSSSDIGQTLQEGLAYISEQIGAEAASFFYLHEENDILRCEACIGPTDILGLEIPATAGIVGAVTQSDTMRFVADTSQDEDFTGAVDAKTGFMTKSMICVPVSGHGRHFGALQVINRLDGALFSEADAGLMSIYGKSAALALANSEMTARMVAADAIERDLKMASRVQESLFPTQKLDFIYGINIPKKGVSGDLYDYVERDGKVYFCMTDVSGKGTDAALVMAKTHSLFRSLSRTFPSIDDLAASINRELTETAFNGMFVTAIIGCYDPINGEMSCCNAGHEPGLLLDKNGSTHYVEASLQPLGIMEFDSADITIEHHDLSDKRFFCYSDGITEAEIDTAMLGAKRLAAILSEQMKLPIATQITNTVEVVRAKARMLADDLTLLGLGCEAEPAADDTFHGTQLEPSLSGEKLLFNISLVNQIPELRRLRREIERTLSNTAAREIIRSVCLAVDEATQNIIRHAFKDDTTGTIEISAYLKENFLHICLLDNAPLIDIEEIKPREVDDVRPGGLGTHFILEVTERAKWSHDQGRNRLDLTFKI